MIRNLPLDAIYNDTENIGELNGGLNGGLKF
jgi:hypothetical protein